VAGKPSPNSKSRIRVNIKISRNKNDMSVLIPNVLVDDEYTETLCIQPKYAKMLGLSRRKKSHPLKLGNGSITQEYSYAMGKTPSDIAVCKFQFQNQIGKKRIRETVQCTLCDIYEDKEENIIGARALLNLGVLVDCGTSLRKCVRQKV
jgi:23S rRNA A1618 N6-methylase RlmF